MALVVRVSDAAFVECAARLIDLMVENGDITGSLYPEITAFHRGTEYVLQTSHKVWKTKVKDDFLLYFITLISTYYLANCTETVLHAGAIIVDDEVVLFSGLARTGKSAICLNAWRQGFQVIGDDWVMLDASNCEVQAFPKPIRPRLPDLGIPPELLNLEMHPEDYLIGEFHGDYRLILGRRLKNMVPFGVSLPVRNLYLIERGERSDVMHVSREVVLKTILEQVKSKCSSPLRAAKFLEPLWRKKRVHRLIVGENDLLAALDLMTGNRL